MSTFVTVGNAHQPFQRLLDAVSSFASQLPQPVIVQFGHGRFSAPGCDARAFIEMNEFERLIREAQVVIQHAGVGGVLLAIRAGKVPVIMPRRAAFGECIDDHQLENAAVLARRNQAVVIEDASELLPAVEKALAMQRVRQAEAREPELVRLVRETLRRYGNDQR